MTLMDIGPNITTTDWYSQAACTDRPDLDWFTHLHTPEEKEMARRCKAVCQVCPVQTACLDHAIRYKEEGGIWGGLDELERRSNKRRVSIARRTAGCCPKCEDKTPTVRTSRGQLECLDCGTRWPPL